MPYLPAGLAVAVPQVANLPVGLWLEAVAFDTAEGFADAFGHIVAAIEGDEQAAARHEIDEALEGSLDGAEVCVDVGVVELNVSEDQRVREVVQELRTLVEEGGVVLVALDDEGPRGAELKAGSEVLSYAADEEGRLERDIVMRSDLVDPREHACCCCFAMRAGNHERFAAL